MILNQCEHGKNLQFNFAFYLDSNQIFFGWVSVHCCNVLGTNAAFVLNFLIHINEVESDSGLLVA